jgi:hypothetical protein
MLGVAGSCDELLKTRRGGHTAVRSGGMMRKGIGGVLGFIVGGYAGSVLGGPLAGLVAIVVGEGHVTEVKSGLKKGETVVVSGQFLLDSESQLLEALQKLAASRLQVKN